MSTRQCRAMRTPSKKSHVHNISGYCPTIRWTLVLLITCKYRLETSLKYVENIGSDTEGSEVNIVRQIATGILILAAKLLFDYINLEVFA